ncbi:MAG: hypothetical protein QNJ88_05400 [Acidimicrobiia bacterium]|nr:hypothetical protein [Acidimicrobiia bacterium]
MGLDPSVVEWLLEGDPAVAWQTRRDLLDDAAGAAADRERIATEGWGARMLSHQDPEGTWGDAIYSPKWTSTTYSLLELYRYGLAADHPAAQRGVEVLLDRMRYIDGGLTPAKTVPEPETCVTGMVVQLDTYFGIDDGRADALVDWLLDEQLADGGWNCDTYRTDTTHGSFHTTITVLEAFLERTARRPDSRLDEAAARGREFFLNHRLYHSHRTGAVADDVFTRFSFPPRWHFDALRGLDYFQASAAERDERLAEAIALVHTRRRKDGMWPLQNVHRNRVWFTMERGGRPSRWNTLRALRVLRWWDGQRR